MSSTQITASGGEGEPPRNISGDGRTLPGNTGGFFSLYKSGQGYWTRLGTALGAGGVILFIAWFVFRETSIFVSRTGPRYAMAAGAVALLALITWWLVNTPRRAQFLIDTDGEMKKVNWAGWSELIGSTKIVVAFMLLTAVSLFVFDAQFQAFFYAINVWHIPFDPRVGVATGMLLAIVLLCIGVGLLRTGESKASKTFGITTLVLGTVIGAAWMIFALTGAELSTTTAAAGAAAGT